MGARTEDIQKAFSYIKKPNPKVFEIGFGNGRDAKEISKYTSNYVGIDLSEEMIKLAQKNVPELTFVLADLETYQFPKDVDVFFAFASLLHSDKESLENLFDKISTSLNDGGVFFLSSKLGEYHKETIDKEGHGPKTYYFYSPEEIEKISPSNLSMVFREIQDFKGQKWFSVILQKTT